MRFLGQGRHYFLTDSEAQPHVIQVDPTDTAPAPTLSEKCGINQIYYSCTVSLCGEKRTEKYGTGGFYINYASEVPSAFYISHRPQLRHEEAPY